MNLTIFTASGSKYAVTEEEHGLRVVREGGAHYAGRAGGGRLALSVEAEVGKPAVFFWGTGRDDFSPAADWIPDEARARFTETSKVTGIIVGTGEAAHYVLHTTPGAS